MFGAKAKKQSINTHTHTHPQTDAHRQKRFVPVVVDAVPPVMTMRMMNAPTMTRLAIMAMVVVVGPLWNLQPTLGFCPTVPKVLLLQQHNVDRIQQANGLLARKETMNNHNVHHDADNNNNDIDIDNGVDTSRRNALLTIATTAAMVGSPNSALAGEVGARINKAVTQSELGISVRTAVVRGAQTMDKLDGQWEEFSDRFGLGTERSKQSDRPKAKDIPPLGPLDTAVAQSILDLSDRAFCVASGLSERKLGDATSRVRALVKPSFGRSGVVDLDGPTIGTAERFNFESFVHFKAYTELLLDKDNGVDFKQFKPAFEDKLGTSLLMLLYPEYSKVVSAAAPSFKLRRLQQGLEALDAVTSILKDKGLLALAERSEIDKDDLNDWTRDLAAIQFSLALDGDATLNAQILLQEQGIRLIPSYTRFMAGVLLQQPEQQLTLEEYYMDTNYNSNPDLFEVKEVLLNVVLEST